MSNRRRQSGTFCDGACSSGRPSQPCARRWRIFRTTAGFTDREAGKNDNQQKHCKKKPVRRQKKAAPRSNPSQSTAGNNGGGSSGNLAQGMGTSEWTQPSGGSSQGSSGGSQGMGTSEWTQPSGGSSQGSSGGSQGMGTSEWTQPSGGSSQGSSGGGQAMGQSGWTQPGGGSSASQGMGQSGWTQPSGGGGGGGNQGFHPADRARVWASQDGLNPPAVALDRALLVVADLSRHHYLDRCLSKSKATTCPEMATATAAMAWPRARVSPD